MVLRSRLASHGKIFRDTDTHHHLVQNLSLASRTQKSILLAQSDVAMQVVEKVVTNACGEMEIEPEEDARNGTGYAFVASGTGLGGGGGLNRGRGNGGGGNGRRQEREQQGDRKFCTHHECRDRFKHQLPPQHQQPQAQHQHQ